MREPLGYNASTYEKEANRMAVMQASKLATAPAYGVLPAEDLERARRFYHDTLGFEMEDFPEMRQFMVRAGGGTQFMIYERARTKAEHTALAFQVDDLDATMQDLRSRGIKFEEYDMPGLKTEGGVARMAEGASAWFTDPEGNIVNIHEAG